MDVRRRTISVVAIAGLTLAMAASAAAWSGTPDQPRPTTPSPVPTAVPVDVGEVPRLAPPDTSDLDCDGPLIVTMQSLRVSEPGDGIPTLGDAESLMDELAGSADFPENVRVEFADDRSGALEPGQPTRFYGHDPDDGLASIVDIVSTANGFVVDRFVACSSSPMEEPDENLQRLPIPSLEELVAEDEAR